MIEQSRLYAKVRLSKPEVTVLFHGLEMQVFSFRELSGGVINSNFMVETDLGLKLLRVYNPERTEPEIVFELSVLQRLRDQGLNAQTPVAGTHIHYIKGFPCTVLEFIEGTTLSATELTPGLAKQAGVELAKMQAALLGFVPKGNKSPCDTQEIGSILQEACELLEVDSSHKVKALWSTASLLLDDSRSVNGVVHADIYPGNTIVSDGIVKAFIDFDDSYYGNQFMDVAIAAMEFSSRDGTHLDIPLLQAFVRGYENNGNELDPDQLVIGMWVNCFRFFAYTLPMTLQEGRDWSDNDYVKRIMLFADTQFRAEVAQAVEDAR